MAGFADAHKSAIASGFPDTIDTYGLVSGKQTAESFVYISHLLSLFTLFVYLLGLWTSTFALGAFIGPTVAGILFDNIGFPWGTLFVIGVHLVVLGLLLVVYIDMKLTSLPEIQVTEEEPLIGQSETYGAIGGRDSEQGSSGLRYEKKTRQKNS